MKARYQIFISSTFADLREERLAISKALLDMGHIPSGMELFPATDTEQLTYIKKVIDECDYYILVIGGRYGSTDAVGISYTEREYDYAVESGKTVLAFLHENPDELKVINTDRDQDKAEKLAAFLARVKEGRLVRFWSTSTDLVAQAIVSLTHAISEFPQPGWIRANMVPSEATLSELIALREQNEKLRKAQSAQIDKVPDRFEDVATLDAKKVVSFKYKKPSYAGTNSGDMELTLAEVFLSMAGKFHTPATPAMSALSLRELIMRKTGFVDVVIDQRDYEQVLIHFRAMGLMTMKVGLGTDQRQYTFFQLSPAGEKVWIEETYIHEIGA